MTSIKSIDASRLYRKARIVGGAVTDRLARLSYDRVHTMRYEKF